MNLSSGLTIDKLNANDLAPSSDVEEGLFTLNNFGTNNKHLYLQGQPAPQVLYTKDLLLCQVFFTLILRNVVRTAVKCPVLVHLLVEPHSLYKVVVSLGHKYNY